MGILNRAELLLRAENYSGSGDWLDESGNGHDAQLGSTSGADSNDPVWKGLVNEEQYLYLPGSGGNYASAPDVNLLDADTAHCYQSKGDWVVNAGSNLGVYDVAGAFGGKAVGHDVSASSTIHKLNLADAIPVSPSTEYTFTTYLYRDSSATDSVTHFEVAAFDYDSSDVFGAAYGGVDVAVVNDDWVKASVTFTTAADAAKVRLFVHTTNGTTLVQATGRYYQDRSCLKLGSDTSFVPSTRIVGVNDIRVRAALPTWTPATFPRLAAKFGSAASSRAVEIYVNSTAGTLAARYYDTGGSAYSQTSSVATGLADGQFAEIKAVVDPDNGTAQHEVRFYVDGVQLGTAKTAGGALSGIQPVGSPVAVGADSAGLSAAEGDFDYAEWRDGENGPVVYREDFTDRTRWQEPFSSATSADGYHTTTINRSSSGVPSTIVDRPMFLLDGVDDYLSIADHPDLNFGAADDFTVVAVGRAEWSNTAERVLVAKRANASATAAGYYLRQGYGALASEIADGTNECGDSEATEPPDNTTAVLGFVRNTTDTDIEFFTNGVGTGSPATDTTTGSLANAFPLMVGRYSSSTVYFRGQVHAVALFREALTDAEMEQLVTELSYLVRSRSRIATTGELLLSGGLARP